MSFPIIDVSQIDNPESQAAIAKEVTDACKQWGFLLLKGHSIPSQEIEEMFALNKAFFSLPEDYRDACPIDSDYVGYIGPLNKINKDDKMSMVFTGAPGFLSNHKSIHGFWHPHIDKIEDFRHKCHELVLNLLICFGIGMNLPDRNFFADAHQADAGKGNTFRMLTYRSHDKRPNATRFQEHTDGGSVTLLFQQQVGLEVLSPSGEWVMAPCIKDCIIVNLGVALSVWSGSELKATLHRVTFDGLPCDKERRSIAYFGTPNPDTVLRPVIPGNDFMEERTANGFELYPGITMGELDEMYYARITGKEAPKRRREAVAV